MRAAGYQEKGVVIQPQIPTEDPVHGEDQVSSPIRLEGERQTPCMHYWVNRRIECSVPGWTPSSSSEDGREKKENTPGAAINRVDPLNLRAVN